MFRLPRYKSETIVWSPEVPSYGIAEVGAVGTKFDVAAVNEELERSVLKDGEAYLLPRQPSPMAYVIRLKEVREDSENHVVRFVRTNPGLSAAFEYEVVVDEGLLSFFVPADKFCCLTYDGDGMCSIEPVCIVEVTQWPYSRPEPAPVRPQPEPLPNIDYSAEDDPVTARVEEALRRMGFDPQAVPATAAPMTEEDEGEEEEFAQYAEPEDEEDEDEEEFDSGRDRVAEGVADSASDDSGDSGERTFDREERSAASDEEDGAGEEIAAISEEPSAAEEPANNRR